MGNAQVIGQTGNHIITLEFTQAHNGEQSETYNSKLKRTKKERAFRLRTDLFSLSVCNMDVGLAHKVFDRSNVMLALKGVVQILR